MWVKDWIPGSGSYDPSAHAVAILETAAEYTPADTDVSRTERWPLSQEAATKEHGDHVCLPKSPSKLLP